MSTTPQPQRKRPKRELTTTSSPRADMDGDSQMHSSADEDEMFPDEALPNPSTPMNASIANLANQADLSPPDSQPGPSQPRDTSNLSSTVNANGKRPLSLAAQTASNMAPGMYKDNETGYTWTKQEDQPGWEWRSLRAREEESRALDNIVDLSSQIKTKYGDPLDPSVPMKGKR